MRKALRACLITWLKVKGTGSRGFGKRPSTSEVPIGVLQGLKPDVDLIGLIGTVENGE
jgi:hypothetical protein